MSKYQKVATIHRYYKITKFYPFLKNTAIQGGVSILIFVVVLLVLELFFMDLNSVLEALVANFSAGVVFLTFLVSETFLGLLPPEIFIAWSSKSASPLLFLTILATLSYVGGIISYLMGKQLFLIPAVRYHIEHKIARHIYNLKKWGGFLIIVGAMLPIPHSVVSLACGLIKFKFSSYLLWALFRFLRFGIYAIVIFNVFQA